MKAARCSALTFVLALVVSLTAGCRKRKALTAPASDPAADAPASEPAATPAAPAPVLPAGPGTALAPSPAGDPAQEAVKTQDRFNRNTGWISKLSGNDPRTRAQALAEIQKAGLSPAEMQELRKQAQMYGVRL